MTIFFKLMKLLDFDKFFLKMLNYLSEGIDHAKGNNHKECIICHYWFFNHRFKYQNFICNGCHDLTMLCLNISDTAIIIVKGVDCCCIIHDISRFEAIYLLENSVLNDCGYIYI